MSNFARKVRRSSGTTSRQRARDLIAARLKRQSAERVAADRMHYRPMVSPRATMPAMNTWSIGDTDFPMDDDLKVDDLNVRLEPDPGAWPPPVLRETPVEISFDCTVGDDFDPA